MYPDSLTLIFYVRRISYINLCFFGDFMAQSFTFGKFLLFLGEQLYVNWHLLLTSA